MMFHALLYIEMQRANALTGACKGAPSLHPQRFHAAMF
jgi:hypothetical protein